VLGSRSWKLEEVFVACSLEEFGSAWIVEGVCIWICFGLCLY
jgi:hypothetical protein